jgi:hypothetical protein
MRNAPFPDSGRSPEAAAYLASQLERLMAMSLTLPAETDSWYDEVAAVKQSLEIRFPKFEPFHEVWHFFADADIRRRDGKYRDYQHRIMSEYIRHLRNEKPDAK